MAKLQGAFEIQGKLHLHEKHAVTGLHSGDIATERRSYPGSFDAF